MKKKLRFVFIFCFTILMVASYAKTIKEYILIDCNHPYILTSSEPYEIEILHKKQNYATVKKEQWKKEESYYRLDIPFEKEGIYELNDRQIIVHQNQQPLFTTDSKPYLTYQNKQVYLKQVEFYVLKDQLHDFKLMMNNEVVLPNKQMTFNQKSYDYYFLTQKGIYEGYYDGQLVTDFFITDTKPNLKIVEDFKDSNFVKKEGVTFLRLNKHHDLSISLSFDQVEVQNYLKFENLVIPLKESVIDVSMFWPFPLEKTQLYIIDNLAPILHGLEEEKECYYLKEMPKFEIEEQYLDDLNSKIYQDGKECKINEIENRSSTLTFKLVDQARNRYEREFKVIIDHQAPKLEVNGQEIKIVEQYLKDIQLKATWNNEVLDLKFENQVYLLPEKKEGILEIIGELSDLSGNITSINYSSMIDFKNPVIKDHLKDNLYTIEIDELNMMSLEVQIRNQNGVVQTTNKQQITLPDGFYTANVICYDKFNHHTQFNNEFMVDTKPPIIQCDLEKDVIIDSNWQVELKIDDALLKSWSYLLKRNNQIIEKIEGKTNEINKEYHENQYIDDGSYELECIAYDLSGKKTVFNKQFRVITKKPTISLLIDGVYVKPTHIISLVKDANISLKSDKGVISWELYFNDQKINQGSLSNLNLKQQSGTYVLDVHAIDEYGYKKDMRYLFYYPKKKTEAIIKKQEPISLENIKIDDSKIILTPTNPKTNQLINVNYLRIGGVLIAISCFGWFIYGRKRFVRRKNSF